MHDKTHLSMHPLPASLFRFSVVLATVAAGLCVAGPAAGQTQPPEAPVLWSVVSRTEALRVDWHFVTGADSYDVRWKGPGQSYHDSRMDEDIEYPYIIRGLTNGTEYTVQVRASNSAGNSGWSNELSRRPTAAPDAPVLRATPGDRSITVTWDAVAGAYYYQLAWSGNGESGLDNGVWSTSYTIENLEPGPYRLTARTRNAEGNYSERSEYVYATVRNHIGPGTVVLCGARIGTPTRLSRDAEVDVCWDAGEEIPTGTDVVIEARERYYWDDAQPFTPWEQIARGDSFTACSGGDGTCLQYTHVSWRGLAIEMELRIRRRDTVLGTSPVLKAHMPNSDTNELRSRLSRAIDEDTRRRIDVAKGPFVMLLEFTDPYLHLALTEIVLGLEPADFEVTNATVTGVVGSLDDSGVYRVHVTPTTLGEPVTIGLPANRVKGVGEGISSSGRNNYTRDNTASNTVVQKTAAPGSRDARSVDAPLTAAFEDVPAAHRGRGSFNVRLRFSEGMSRDYPTLQNKAVTVVGGRMLAVKRVDDRSDLWSVTVAPKSAAPVTLRVGAPAACADAGAVCTTDGRALSNSPSVTIPGPGGGASPTGPGEREAAEAVNRPPRAMGTIPPQVLGIEDAELTLDTAPYFADEDEDGLTFAARSTDPGVAAVSMAGPLLLVTAVGPGTAAVTVTASEAAGLSAEQAFELRVADRWGHAATGDTLAALGRGYLSSVRATLGRRVESLGPEAEMTVAGQRIPLDRSTAREAGVALVRRLFPQAGSPGRPRLVGHVSPRQAGFGGPGLGSLAPGASAFGMPGSGRARPGAGRGLPAGFPSTMGPGHLAVGSPDGRGGLGLFGGGASHALRSTNVALPLGGVSAGQASDGAAPASPGRRWTVWGQGDVQAFRGGAAAGAEGSGATYDGDLQTVYAGVDARLNEQWMTGVALARSAGSASWDAGPSHGRLATALTAVHPYVRWSRGGTTVWALGGLGRGTAENVGAAPAGGLETTGLGLGLGLVEARREVAVIGGGVRLGLRGELSWAHLATDAGGETLDALEAGVRRTRAGFEASRGWSRPSGMHLEPFGRLSVRQDGGAGQTGVGLELESGVRLSAGLLRVEAEGRMLALHTASAYAERGASVSVSVGEGAERPGLTLSVAPRGGAARGADMLWQEQLHRPWGMSAGSDERSVDARVSYGWRLPRRLLVAPFGGYGTGWGRRRLQMGATLGSLDAGTTASAPVRLEVSGERHLLRQGGADHRVSLLGVVTFGARPAATSVLPAVR